MGIATYKTIHRNTDIAEQTKVIDERRVSQLKERGIGEILFPAKQMQHQHGEYSHAFEHF